METFVCVCMSVFLKTRPQDLSEGPGEPHQLPKSSLCVCAHTHICPWVTRSVSVTGASLQPQGLMWPRCQPQGSLGSGGQQPGSKLLIHVQMDPPCMFPTNGSSSSSAKECNRMTSTVLFVLICVACHAYTSIHVACVCAYWEYMLILTTGGACGAWSYSNLTSVVLPDSFSPSFSLPHRTKDFLYPTGVKHS